LTRDKALELIAKDDRSIFVDSLRQYPLKDAAAHVIGYIGQITPEQIKDKNFSDYQITDLIGKSGIEYQYESLLRGTNGKELIEVDATGKKIRTLGQTDPILAATLILAASRAENVKKGEFSTQMTNTFSHLKPHLTVFTLDESYKQLTA
jgi:penicillin-binding protein 2